jgi:hypothetical protein
MSGRDTQIEMTVMTRDGGHSRVKVEGSIDVDRLTALTDILDWAEAEAAALNAPDAGMCLQLARLALMARTAQP